MKTSRRANSGSVLLLAVVGFVLMAGIGAALFSLAITSQKSAMHAANADGAYAVAEAGIDDAINKMKAYQQFPDNTSADYSVISITKTTASGVDVNVVEGSFQSGSYYVTVEPPYTGLGNYKITSVGRANGEKRGIVTWISAQYDQQPEPTGLFGDVYLDAGGNIKTDGYHSSKGSWKSQITSSAPGFEVAEMLGNVGSNGGINVGGSSVIYGNAVPGPGKSVAGGGKVYGTTTPASGPVMLPDTDFTIPQNTQTIKGDLAKGGNVSAGTYVLKTLSPNGQSQVNISGDVVLYVQGDVSIVGQVQFNIPDGSSLKIYQTSSTASFNIAGGSLVNSAQIPAAFSFLSNTEKGTVNGNSDFFGTVYAPKTAIKVAGNAGVFGAVTGKSIDVIGTPYFHYDASLGDQVVPQISFAVKSVQQFVPGVTDEVAK
jgi:hypothetical protein